MKSYDDILDILHDAWEQTAAMPYAASGWVINAHDVITTLIDSFVEDGQADFLDALDAAYEDLEGIPQGKERDVLRSVIGELARYEF